MPNIDISRDATDPTKHYDRVQMQQGRVLTDDDFNEAERLDAEDARRVRVDVIGPAGSPDDGFRLKTVDGELVLSAGTYYVGGVRLELEADEPFNLQKDWLQQGSSPNETLTTPAGEQFDFVWLDVWQQPVTAVEDKELFEAALGGADTATRIRTMRRARVLRNIGHVDCAAAWTQLLNALVPFGTVNGDFELVPNATLQVGPDGTTSTDNLCSPPINGGYLGAENQAIRVQVVGPNRFTWGFDNGAPLYRVKLEADTSGSLRRLHMLTVPKDQAHYPLEGQVVELLPWSALLSNGQKNAELSGFLTKVTSSYNPDTQDLLIMAAPGNDTGAPPRPFGRRWADRSDNNAISNEDPPEDVYFYMRVWNRGGDTASPAAIPFVVNAPVPLAQTGLQVTFSGTNLRTHAFWIIAARPQTPDILVPWELSAGRSPHGVRRWIAPLGIIRWPSASRPVEVQDDCRPTFLPLTRLKGCCTLSVGDGTHSFGNFGRIQDAVNALPPAGGQICVLPGIYNESVLISQRVSIKIHGCGPRSRVQAVSPNNNPLPGFMISNSTEITVEGLAIESGPRSAVHITNARHVNIVNCLVQMRDLRTTWPGIFSQGDDVLIQSNTIEVLRTGPLPVTVPPPTGTDGAPAGTITPTFPPVNRGNVTRGGIQLGGGSDRVKILDNIIQGGTWNGITLGSLRLIRPNNPIDFPDHPRSDDPCEPACRPPDLTVVADRADPAARWESAGDLYDVKIARNRITDMGINGISVVRFFNLAENAEMVGVHGLHIQDNYITRCLWRDLAQVGQAMNVFIAYGGITLAKVADLRILRNELVLNGNTHLQPICGVFAIIVQGLQLDDNRIIDNGAKTEQPVENAQTGIRGGVHIWAILPFVEPTSWSSPNALSFLRERGRNALPTCSMRDNIIVAPLGRALTFFTLGPVVVARNRLVTQGTTGTRGLDLIAATVFIGNFGLSNEWTPGLLTALVLLIFEVITRDPIENLCRISVALGFMAPQSVVRRWATGKTLISENQITLDVIDQPQSFGISSIFIFSADDLAVVDNQIEIITTRVFYFADALLVGGSVRVADNRFAETWMRTFISAWSIGLMNTTTDNQATHCLLATALPQLKVFRDNLMLLSDAFCPGVCGRSQQDSFTRDPVNMTTVPVPP